MAIIATGIAALIVYGQKGTQSVQRRLSTTELRSFVTQVIGNPALCKNSFYGKPAPSVGNSLPTLNFAGTLIDDGANNLFSRQVKITSLKYNSVSILGNVYSAVARLTVDLRGSGSEYIVGGNSVAPIDFPIVATVAGGAIQSCGSSAPTTQVAGTWPSCTTPHVAQGSCQSTVNWPVAFPDNNYVVTCSLEGPFTDITACSQPGSCIWIGSVTHTPSQVAVKILTGTASQSQSEHAAAVTCIGVHP